MILLFDANQAYLGELLLDEGRLKHFVLTQMGENLIGSHAVQWQTRGIGVSRLIPSVKPDGSREDVTFQQYVQPREHGFGDAFRLWAAEHGYHAVEMDDRMMSLWELLLRLPFDPAERHAVLLAIRSTPNQFHEWRSCLQEADTVVSGPAKRPDRDRQILKIKAKAGKVF